MFDAPTFPAPESMLPDHNAARPQAQGPAARVTSHASLATCMPLTLDVPSYLSRLLPFICECRLRTLCSAHPRFDPPSRCCHITSCSPLPTHGPWGSASSHGSSATCPSTAPRPTRSTTASGPSRSRSQAQPEPSRKLPELRRASRSRAPSSHRCSAKTLTSG